MLGVGSILTSQRAAQREKEAKNAANHHRNGRASASTSTTTTTPSSAKGKLSLFKSSDRTPQSQQPADLNNSFQTAPYIDTRVSPPTSPFDDSPTTSPTLYTASAAASSGTAPVTSDHYPNATIDDPRPPIERNRSSDNSRSGQRNRLRRRASSQRSPPPIKANSFALPPPPPRQNSPANAGSAGRPPSRADLVALQLNTPAASYTWSVDPPQPESPKPAKSSLAKRFFSFGTQASHHSREGASSANPWSRPKLGRSSSVRSNNAETTRTSIDASSIGPPLRLGSQDEAVHPDFLPPITNRHSVAFPAPNVPEDIRSLVNPNALEFLQNTSDKKGAGGVISLGETRGELSPGRSIIPELHTQLSSQLTASTISTNARDPRSGLLGTDRVLGLGSRSPSRQSAEPPSPPTSSAGFNRKSPSAASLVEQMSGNPGQHGGRSGESGHQQTQSGSSRDGGYGPNLSVNSRAGGSSHGNTPQQSPMGQNSNSTDQAGQRGNTPPPSRSRDDLNQMDFQSLVSKHEELNDKYRKVKKYYFDKDSQVQQLQNALAHQRLAQSKTSLDDNEYLTRFNRLDGAINNLAFNIRKDWKAVPRWLAPHVNQEATNTVSKEMTAVGRACISRWIVDEIFDRYFHPGLEPNLSSHLKVIERNLRRFAPPLQTEDDREALLAKISNWRLATLDGLQDMLNTHEAVEYRTSLTNILVEMLTSDLMMNLKDPPPPGLDAGVVGIIELAINVAANLPLESRDVFVDYVMPGTAVNEQFMKVDSSLPPLVNPGEGAAGDADANNSSSDKKDGDAAKDQKVRFAAFMSVEVRGKNMLVKAPVYT